MALAPLQAAAILAAAINPPQARDFAKATGRLVQTDRIDSVAQAHFAQAVRPEPRPAASDDQRSLEALLSRRGQLMEMRVMMESNRLSTCADTTVGATIERHIAWLRTKVAEADRFLCEAVQANPDWWGRDEWLRSIPGIGPVISRTLLASLPELGIADGGQLSALAGRAPFAHDSGTLKEARHIRGGRGDVRRVFDLASPSVARRNGPLKAFADRLRSRGKKPKVVLIAVGRKQLTIANAVIRSGLRWDPAKAMAR